MTAFKEAYSPELKSESHELETAIGTGADLGLMFLLDKKSFFSAMRRYADNQESLGSYKIGFSMAESPFAIQSHHHVNVRLGYRTEILLTPFELFSSDGLKDSELGLSLIHI